MASSSKLQTITEDEEFDTDSILTSLNADFYEFKISDLKEKPVAKGNKKAAKGKNHQGNHLFPKNKLNKI